MKYQFDTGLILGQYLSIDSIRVGVRVEVRVGVSVEVRVGEG